MVYLGGPRRVCPHPADPAFLQKGHRSPYTAPLRGPPHTDRQPVLTRGLTSSEDWKASPNKFWLRRLIPIDRWTDRQLTLETRRDLLGYLKQLEDQLPGAMRTLGSVFQECRLVLQLSMLEDVKTDLRTLSTWVMNTLVLAPTERVQPEQRGWVSILGPPHLSTTNWGSEQPIIILLQFWKPKRPKSRCRQGSALSKGSRGGSFLSLQLLVAQVFTDLWLQHSNLCLHGHMAVPNARAEEPTYPQRASTPPAVPVIDIRGHIAIMLVKPHSWCPQMSPSWVRGPCLGDTKLDKPHPAQQHAVAQHSGHCLPWVDPVLRAPGSVPERGQSVLGS